VYHATSFGQDHGGLEDKLDLFVGRVIQEEVEPGALPDAASS